MTTLIKLSELKYGFLYRYLLLILYRFRSHKHFVIKISCVLFQLYVQPVYQISLKSVQYNFACVRVLTFMESNARNTCTQDDMIAVFDETIEVAWIWQKIFNMQRHCNIFAFIVLASIRTKWKSKIIAYGSVVTLIFFLGLYDVCLQKQLYTYV